MDPTNMEGVEGDKNLAPIEMSSDIIDKVAESIWQAEWARAGNGGARRVPWSEIAESDQARYRFVAKAALITYLNWKLTEVSGF